MDWEHEYAGFSGATEAAVRQRRRAKKRRRRLIFAALMILEVALTALATQYVTTHTTWATGLFEASGFSSLLPVAPAQAAGTRAVPLGADVADEVPTDAPAETPPAMQPVLQEPELPNGCEAASLAALLGWHGHAADKVDLAYNYIPRRDFGEVDGVRTGPHPADAYAGDPADRGFYCLPGPLAEGGNLYLQAQGSALACSDVSGLGLEDIETSINDGTPVVLWVTLDYRPEAKLSTFTWQLDSGEGFTPYSNLHCVVAYGVDGDDFLLCDPMEGNLQMNKQTVYESYLALGAYAMVISR